MQLHFIESGMAVLNHIKYSSSSITLASRKPISFHKISQISSVLRSFFTLYNYSSLPCLGQAKPSRSFSYDLILKQYHCFWHKWSMFSIYVIYCISTLGPGQGKIIREIQCFYPYFLNPYNLLKQICNYNIWPYYGILEEEVCLQNKYIYNC